jgi:hypothetical protein
MQVSTKRHSRRLLRRLAGPVAAVTRSGAWSSASSTNSVLIIHSPLHPGAGCLFAFNQKVAKSPSLRLNLRNPTASGGLSSCDSADEPEEGALSWIASRIAPPYCPGDAAASLFRI